VQVVCCDPRAVKRPEETELLRISVLSVIDVRSSEGSRSNGNLFVVLIATL